MRLTVDYDPLAGTGELFKKVLNDVFEGDQDVIDYLQRCLGYSILGLKNGEFEQRFFFGYGPRGGNVKNTIFDPIMDILGSYGGIASAGTFNFDKSKIPEDLHQLRHTRVILASEPSQREQMDEEMVKAITGNKSVRTRQLHQNSVTWSPKFCVWMLANHYPKVPNSDSLFRRFVIFPFNRVFRPEERVMGLGQQLFEHEGSAILNWLIEGAQKWMKEALNKDVPSKCSDIWTAFRESVDVLRAFLTENLKQRPEKCDRQHQDAASVFARYKQWCHDNNYYPLGRNKFYTELAGYGVRTDRRAQGMVLLNVILEEDENSGGLFS
jgi:putative DNA primase/helicase